MLPRSPWSRSVFSFGRAWPLWGLALGCSAERTGPDPSLTAPPAEPALLCAVQRTTLVSVSGAGLSPVVVDLPASARVALPDLRLVRSAALDGRPEAAIEVLISGDADRPANLEHLRWLGHERLELRVDQGLEGPDGVEGPLPLGVLDLEVVNPSGASARHPGALAVVDRPHLTSLTPSVLCLAQGARTASVAGTNLLELGGEPPRLRVDGAAESLAIEALSGCVAVAQESVEARLCTGGRVELPADHVGPGLHALTVGNPETAACTSEETWRLRVVAPPSIERVVPPIACLAEGPRSIRVEGADLLRVDGRPPAITIGGIAFPVTGMDGCTPLETEALRVERCTALELSLGRGSLPPGQPEIVVTNPAPAGCLATHATGLRIVPPPAVDAVEPSLVCLEDGARRLRLEGRELLEIDGASPSVEIAGVAVTASVAAEGCAALPVDGLTVRRCEALWLSVPAAALPSGAHDVVVRNPDPAGCSGLGEDVLTVVPGPRIRSAEPPLVCTDTATRSLVLRGEGFLEIDGQWPRVRLDGRARPVRDLRDCELVSAPRHATQSCRTLELSLPQGALAAGAVRVEVESPAPAGCVATSSTVLTVPPPPRILAVEPPSVCAGAPDPVRLTIRGEGLLSVDGRSFELAIGGRILSPIARRDCAPLAVDGQSVEVCDTLELSLPAAAFAAEGELPVAIDNPDAACDLVATGVLVAAPPPTLTALDPARVCSDRTTMIAVDGRGFTTATRVRVGGIDASRVRAVSDRRLELDLPPLAPGVYDVELDNGPGCRTIEAAALIVDPTPLVFFVDPPVLYDGITVEATLFTSGLEATARGVELVDASGAVTPIVDFASPRRPNRIQAVVPAGLPAGPYDVRVTSDRGCNGVLPAAVTITDRLTLALSSVDPAFSATASVTAVTIRAQDPPPVGQVGFESTPRAYLSPSGGAGGGATALRSVVFADASTLSGLVPAGLPAGAYDLIVANPSGAVGLLPSAVTITATPPPVITSVVPGAFDGSQIQTATVRGRGLGGPGAVVRMLCRDPATGTSTSSPATVMAAGDAELTALFPSDRFALGSVCLIELTRAGDAAVASYSAVSIRNPAQNLGAWTPGPSMRVARRGPALVAARPTDTSRYLYAIGGDGGTAATATTSVEAVSVGVFGDLAAWAEQRDALPAPRGFAGVARVGRFLYLTGGHDGRSAVDTVLRAEVLDPLAAPSLDDLDAVLGDGQRGLGAGLWFYRVSARFAADDPLNPGGESLAGEPLVVQLPARPEGIVLSLRWSAVPGAVGYRVYRSPVGVGVDGVRWLADVTTPGYTDEGTTAPAGPSPLPPGSLGRWHVAARLGVAREAHATVVVADPAAAGRWFLYAFGGRDAAGASLASWEVATVTASGRGQTVSAFRAGAPALAEPRAELGAWVVTRDDAAVVGADTWIWIGGGRDGARLSEVVDVGRLGVDGALEARALGPPLRPRRAGYGYAAANGFLFAFGGQQGGASGGGVSAEIEGAQPALSSWNSLGGGAPSGARIHGSVATESAFLFIGGGWDGSAPLSTLERTVQ